MQNSSEKCFLDLYQKRLNLRNAVFVLIDHEDAMIATVYKVTVGKSHQILKICPRAEDYRREIYFLKHFANSLPVPRVIDVVPPEAGVDGAILMECLPGATIKIEDFTDPLAFEIGSQLAKIHLNRAAGYGDLTQPKSLSRDPLVYFTQKFEEELEECRGHLPLGLIKQCSRYYDAHARLLATVDGPCMIHRDFRPGNLIVDQGKLKGIIDWAGGRGGFAEQDFCSMEHWEWPQHPECKKSFMAGYASIRPVPNYSSIMPLLRVSRALGVIGYTVKQGTWDKRDGRVYKYNRTFLEEFFPK